MGLIGKELKTLQYWIDERERIRFARVAGEPAPWTKDKVLREWKFCNVRRDHDRTSIWIHSNIRKAKLSRRDAAFSCAWARRFNLPASLQMMGFPKWDINKVRRACSVMTANGNQVFSGAYMLMGGVNVHGKEKFRSLWEVTIDDMLMPVRDVYKVIDPEYLHKSFKNLRQFRFMGEFIASQVVMDMHAVGVLEPKDLMAWAPVGPGSRFGLNLLYGREKTVRVRHAQVIDEMHETYGALRLPVSVRGMPLYDLEHCICEFYKYRKGGGKQRYNGGAI